VACSVLSASSLADCRPLPPAIAQRMLASQQPGDVPEIITAFCGGAGVANTNWFKPQPGLRAS